MDFDALFSSQIDALKAEGNYRVFAEMERRCGTFPRAAKHGQRRVVPGGRQEQRAVPRVGRRLRRGGDLQRPRR